ncbi:hypothetical protein [Dulcicalothrix desertica]|nr:hypothetical protein [Dulcicalothrix desertica]TWH61003.1 hypothetical protein CAL7102_01080 [Dulcicalothrix desertica PCC 7102]
MEDVSLRAYDLLKMAPEAKCVYLIRLLRNKFNTRRRSHSQDNK